MLIAGMHARFEGYVLLFAWVFAEQIGLPLPAAPALFAAGALAAEGSLNVLVLVFTALSASVLADYLWYRAGALGGSTLDRFLGRHPGSRLLGDAARLVARYGCGCLVFAKFVPGLSLAAPPLSGMAGMSAMRFLLFDAVGSLVWSGGFTGIGFFFGGAIDISSLPVSPRLFVWLWVAPALAFAGFECARALRGKLCERPAAAIAEEVVRTYREDPALPWLARLITGDPASGLDAVPGSANLDDAANPFFARWMVVWSRKLVVAKTLGKVATELKRSARRVALAGRPPKPEWSRLRAVDRSQLDRALARIDVFPRCAVLLTTFEKLSVQDTAVLLDADPKLVLAARAIGLSELARNLAYEQCRVPESRLRPRPTLQAA